MSATRAGLDAERKQITEWLRDDHPLEDVWRRMQRLNAINAALKALPSDDIFDSDDDTPSTDDDRNRIQSAAEFVGDLGPREWLIKNLLPRTAEIFSLYGQWGQSKSFIALDLLCAVHRGIPWNGLKVQQANAVIAVAEGAHDYKYRLAAYAKANGVELDSLPYIIDSSYDLSNAKQTAELAKRLQSADNPGVLLVDTKAASMSGDENSVKDTQLFINHLRFIARQVPGLQVGYIAHAGKNLGAGERGSSSSPAAADAQYVVERVDDNDYVLTVSKQKGGRDGDQYGYRLLTVVLGQDADGDDYGSAVVECKEVTRQTSKAGVSGPVARRIVRYLQDSGELIDRDRLIDDVVLQIPRGKAQRDQRRSTVRRALDSLIKNTQVFERDGSLSLTATIPVPDADWLGEKQ